MFVIAMVKQSGNKDFEGFWEQQEASSYWSELCTKMDSKFKGDPIAEIQLFKADASSIADGIKQARKGQLDMLKSHRPANTKQLREVVRLTGEGLVDDAVLDAANKALYGMADQFLTLISKLVSELSDVVKGLAAGQSASDEHKNRLNEIAYEVKIQGGSFNFPLMSLVGAHLEKFLLKKAQEPMTDTHCVTVMEAYVSTLEYIITHKISGTGGDVGKKLLAQLQAVIKGESQSFELPKVEEKKPQASAPKVEEKAPAPKTEQPAAPAKAASPSAKASASAPAGQSAQAASKPAATPTAEAAPKPTTPKPATPEPGVQSQEALAAMFANASTHDSDDPDPSKVHTEDFEFKDTYKTGCTAMDEDHRYLLHLVKHLYLMNKEHASVFETDLILLMLESYSRVHFGREELLMEKIGDPDLEKHKANHEDMLERLLAVRDEKMATVDKNRQLKSVLKYKQIILEHIIFNDFGYKNMVKGKDDQISALLKDYEVPKSWLGDEV
ncbi:hemerythrin family protein [Terasakiella sp. SH-1]|uniref:bacteriohemerythrin n=1 Tax=Terasakiella sp. SH-1 TaxID=2560057 RepID=UPI001074568C|nr:hemerythrin family protein [Terasakiella sp. SH-1]